MKKVLRTLEFLFTVLLGLIISPTLIYSFIEVDPATPSAVFYSLPFLHWVTGVFLNVGIGLVFTSVYWIPVAIILFIVKATIHIKYNYKKDSKMTS